MEEDDIMEENGLIAIPYQAPIPLIKIDAQGLMDSFLSGKSERTIEAYSRDLDDFRQFLGVEKIGEAANFFLSNQGKQAPLP